MNTIPDFNILFAGFPCQPFSQAGHKQGFKDNNDGNLFFSIEEILKIKKQRFKTKISQPKTAEAKDPKQKIQSQRSQAKAPEPIQS